MLGDRRTPLWLLVMGRLAVIAARHYSPSQETGAILTVHPFRV